jgi:divalent metal cation (Fe/Co/Zn/Cd) transporter
LTGWSILDPLLAAIVACSILWTGYRIAMESMSGLMDESAGIEIQSKVTGAIKAHGTGAVQAHDIRTRHAGRATFIEFHLVVPGIMSVREAHDICDRIEAALEGSIEGAQVTIHVEPGDKAEEASKSTVELSKF